MSLLRRYPNWTPSNGRGFVEQYKLICGSPAAANSLDVVDTSSLPTGLETVVLGDKKYMVVSKSVTAVKANIAYVDVQYAELNTSSSANMVPPPDYTGVWGKQVNLGAWRVDEPAIKDLNGKAYINTAGVKIQPERTKTWIFPLWEFRWCSYTSKDLTIAGLLDHTNSDSVNFTTGEGTVSCSANQILVDDGNVTVVYEISGRCYYQHYLRLKVKAGTVNGTTINWITRIPSYGFAVKDTANPGKLKVLTQDDDGVTPLTDPVYLDANGQKTTTPYVMEFTEKTASALMPLLSALNS